MTEIWDRHGPLAGALNNAAANFIAPTASLSPRAFEAITSTVMAGSFHTDFAWEMLKSTESSSVGATQADQIPMGRGGTIEELANLVIFLFSDACDYLTGETIAMEEASGASKAQRSI